jgi:hypothetical protein
MQTSNSSYKPDAPPEFVEFVEFIGFIDSAFDSRDPMDPINSMNCINCIDGNFFRATSEVRKILLMSLAVAGLLTVPRRFRRGQETRAER